MKYIRLTTTQASVFSVLCVDVPQQIPAIVDACGLDRGTVRATLEYMKKDGYVLKHGSRREVAYSRAPGFGVFERPFNPKDIDDTILESIRTGTRTTKEIVDSLRAVAEPLYVERHIKTLSHKGIIRDTMPRKDPKYSYRAVWEVVE